MTDGPQLQQVILNLINNAIDEIGQGGTIDDPHGPGGQKLVAEFADNGHGIKPENLKRIFDPFFTTKEPGKGTGLGLYISYDIVKKLGGTINVANRDGGGAVFTIVCRSSPSIRSDDRDTGYLRGRNPFIKKEKAMKEFNVLVVDDEQEFRDITVKRLEKRGLKVQGAESGEKALEILEHSYTDVVLLDVKMPGIDGIETLRQIRAMKPLVEVVLLTGHASVDSGIEGMKLGAFDYLMKPIELEPLLEKLADAYEKKRFIRKKSNRQRL
jgi:CheY-like chemotaxis protein